MFLHSNNLTEFTSLPICYLLGNDFSYTHKRLPRFIGSPKLTFNPNEETP